MNAEQSGGRLAQPADEDNKKHGDELERQVRDAAGKTAEGKIPENNEKASGSAA